MPERSLLMEREEAAAAAAAVAAAAETICRRIVRRRFLSFVKRRRRRRRRSSCSRFVADGPATVFAVVAKTPAVVRRMRGFEKRVFRRTVSQRGGIGLGFNLC